MKVKKGLIPIVLIVISVIMLMLPSLGCTPDVEKPPVEKPPVEKPPAEKPPAEKPKPIELRYTCAGRGTDMSPYFIQASIFKELCDKYSDGQIQVEIYQPGELYGNYYESTKACITQTLDMTSTICPMAFPMAGIKEFMCALIMNVTWGDGGNDNVAKFWKSDGGTKLKGLMRDNGVIWMDSIMCSNLIWGWDEAIMKVADLKGKPMRGGALIDLTEEAWGATPVSVASTEVYGALDQGIIEGTLSGRDTFVRYKWYELAPYTAGNFPVTNYESTIIISDTAWNRIPADLQKVITEKVIPELHERSIKSIEENIWDTEVADINKLMKVYQMPEATIEEMVRLSANSAIPIQMEIDPLVTSSVLEACGYKWEDGLKKIN